MSAERRRADLVLVARGLFATRAQAQAAIAAGLVQAAGRRVAKAAELVAADAEIVAVPVHPWVSRGGVKLAHALDAFAMDPRGKECLDVGASTGGFIQVLLARGAARVIAVDVGHGQLHPEVASDKRVVSREGCDIRNLAAADLPAPPDVVTVDVSFVPLALVLPAALALAAPSAALVVLVKPQFEVGRARLGKGGIVRDPTLHAEVVATAEALVTSLGWRLLGTVASPIAGGDGNREFLLGRAVGEELEIVRLGHHGDGVAMAESGAVHVPYALPGERVRVERQPAADRARLIEVVAPSPDRVAPFCPHVGLCGGCAIQHVAPAAALAWKRELVAAAMARARVVADVAQTIDAHGAGRRRVTLHARAEPGGVMTVGFNTARTHDLIDLQASPCPLLVPALAGAEAVVAAIAKTLQSLKKPLDARVTAMHGGLDVDLRGPGRVPEALRLALIELADARDLARLSLHGEVLVERRVPSVHFGGVEVVPPPGGFLQPTEAGEAALSALVTAGVGTARRIADLFSGCGTFALRLATDARVTAIESEADAVEALERAARRASGLKPVTAIRRDLFRRPLQGDELTGFDAVVFDPPRAGAEAQARALATSLVPRVVAVSCDAATLARDLRILVDGGYRIAIVTPVDQFRHSAHIEAVAVLVRDQGRRR